MDTEIESNLVYIRKTQIMILKFSSLYYLRSYWFYLM